MLCMRFFFVTDECTFSVDTGVNGLDNPKVSGIL